MGRLPYSRARSRRDNRDVGVDEAVAAGRAALAAGHWKDARAAFETALAREETPEALDGLGQALCWLGEYGTAVALRERAFAGFRARGETRYPAVIAAYWLAFEYVALYGNYAVASGWLERGKHLAEAAGDCPERGWVELACAMASDDQAVRLRHIEAARRLAVRFGDTDLEFDALAYSGVCLVERGRTDEGMRRLDEAAAAAVGGEVRNVAVVGEIYCKMLLACEMVLDVRRAEQWTAVVEAFVRRTDVVWAAAICRMYYGGILTAAGRWAEAEHELTTSVRLYDASYRALRSGSVARLADLRVRQGRLEEAERLLDGHEHDGYAVRPLAGLHLARGEAERAATVLRRGLAVDGRSAENQGDHEDGDQGDQGDQEGTDQDADQGDHEDGGPEGETLRAPLLALLVEAEAAAGHLAAARLVCARLRALPEAARTPLTRAFTEYAAALAGEGEVRGHLEAALAGFVAAGLPLEEARARRALAEALRPSAPEVAIAEARTALAVSERLGARADADAAAALLRSLGVRGRTGPKQVGVLSKREREVLHLMGLGLSNPEIAERLFISRKTASHHVSNVLTKLGLRNRAEAAAYATARARGEDLDRPTSGK